MSQAKGKKTDDHFLTMRLFVQNLLFRRSFMENNIETDKKDSHKVCSMKETDETGNPTLCCCYLVDDNDDYQDLCFHPADECC